MAPRNKSGSEPAADQVTNEGLAAEQVNQAAEQVNQAAEQASQAHIIAAQSYQILAIADGVQELAGHVSVLNERVYSKNMLDKTRNRLLVGAVAAFVLLSMALGVLLVRINSTASLEARRAKDRAAEALTARRQLADCTTPPGTLFDGFVNPGVCFTETANRTQLYIDVATKRIEDSTRAILAELAQAIASNKSLSSEVRKTAAVQAAVLRAPPRPDPAPVVLLPAPTPAPAPVIVPAPEGKGVVEALVCFVARLLGGC